MMFTPNITDIKLPSKENILLVLHAVNQQYLRGCDTSEIPFEDFKKQIAFCPVIWTVRKKWTLQQALSLALGLNPDKMDTLLWQMIESLEFADVPDLLFQEELIKGMKVCDDPHLNWSAYYFFRVYVEILRILHLHVHEAQLSFEDAQSLLWGNNNRQKLVEQTILIEAITWLDPVFKIFPPQSIFTLSDKTPIKKAVSSKDYQELREEKNKLARENMYLKKKLQNAQIYFAGLVKITKKGNLSNVLDDLSKAGITPDRKTIESHYQEGLKALGFPQKAE